MYAVWWVAHYGVAVCCPLKSARLRPYERDAEEAPGHQQVDHRSEQNEGRTFGVEAVACHGGVLRGGGGRHAAGKQRIAARRDASDACRLPWGDVALSCDEVGQALRCQLAEGAARGGVD